MKILEKSCENKWSLKYNFKKSKVNFSKKQNWRNEII